jgi:putative tricarboxylic transport membrane protein
VVLGFMIESNYRRSMLMAGEDPMIFVTDKVSLGLLLLAAAMTIYSTWNEFKKNRQEAQTLTEKAV